MPTGSETDHQPELVAYAQAKARGRRGEPRLTRAIGHMLSADDVAAGSFARTLIQALEPRRDPPPTRLQCAPEEPRTQAPRRASMCIELKASRGRATYVEIRLDHPAGVGPSVEIIRWRGQRDHRFPAFAVAKNATDAARRSRSRYLGL